MINFTIVLTVIFGIDGAPLSVNRVVLQRAFLHKEFRRVHNLTIATARSMNCRQDLFPAWPATTRTLRGAIIQTAPMETKEMAIASHHA